MYGPQRAEGYTKEQVKEILANKEALLNLKRSFDDIYALSMASVSLEEVNLLISCMGKLGNVMQARIDKIPQEFL
jgi:hypothetical protein